MALPEWLKPALYGAAVGAVAISVAGFSWAGWVTGGTADRRAAETAKAEVVAALVPICIEQARLDPESTVKLAALQGASTSQRPAMLIDAGWATMPGATESDRTVASACMKELAARF
jgi:hypothetical protein